MFFRMYMAAFPDLRMVPEDLIASVDKVVARVRATGTHEGAFMGLSPTGFDQLAMLQQLGAIPAGPPA